MNDEISKTNSTNKTAREIADYELVRKAAAGDIEAFEQIYWRHHRRVFGICMRMTKDVAEAEDITQQVFLQLYKKIGGFRGDSAFTTWLHRITVNQMLMHFRRRKSRKESTTEDGVLPENNLGRSEKSDGENQIITRLQLNEAISQLADGYRRVLILHDIEGYQHDEIAQMLGCAEGTSKSQLHKARNVLRRLLTVGNDLTRRINKAIE